MYIVFSSPHSIPESVKLCGGDGVREAGAARPLPRHAEEVSAEVSLLPGTPGPGLATAAQVARVRGPPVEWPQVRGRQREAGLQSDLATSGIFSNRDGCLRVEDVRIQSIEAPWRQTDKI